MYTLWDDCQFKLGWYFLTWSHPLRYLFLELTRTCNLTCDYCGSDCSPDFQSKEMTTAQWIAAIDQVAADFDPPEIMVGISGGEPFLVKGILDIMANLRKRRFRYGVITNGTLIDAPTAKELVKLKIGSISLSFDAPGDINAKLRGEKSSLGVERAVESLKKAGFKGKLEAFSSITPQTLPLLPNTRRLLASWGIKYWRIAPVFPKGRALSRPDLILNGGQLRQLLDFIREARKDLRLPSPEFSEEGVLPPPYEKTVRPFVSQCRAGITVASILADGAIAACPELGDEFKQGNILKDRFLKIWQTKYQIFRDRSWLKNKGLCRECPHFSRCQGGSLHLYDFDKKSTVRCYWSLLKGDLNL